MSMTISIPKEFGYVILVHGVGTFFALSYLGGEVMKARKQFKVQYPNMYANPKDNPDADKFNNVQRGHQNALETFPSYLALSLIGGLKYPVPVAIGGVFWIVGRILYMEGYKDSADGRYKKGGVVLWLGMLTSLVSTIALAYSLITA